VQRLNRLGILLGHILKWQFQPDKRSNSWLGTIRDQRVQIKLLLQDSPSLLRGIEPLKLTNASRLFFANS